MIFQDSWYDPSTPFEANLVNQKDVGLSLQIVEQTKGTDMKQLSFIKKGVLSSTNLSKVKEYFRSRIRRDKAIGGTLEQHLLLEYPLSESTMKRQILLTIRKTSSHFQSMVPVLHNVGSCLM